MAGLAGGVLQGSYKLGRITALDPAPGPLVGDAEFVDVLHTTLLAASTQVIHINEYYTMIGCHTYLHLKASVSFTHQRIVKTDFFFQIFRCPCKPLVEIGEIGKNDFSRLTPPDSWVQMQFLDESIKCIFGRDKRIKFEFLE